MPKLNRVHWLIVACVILAVSAVGADVTLHVVQQQRIDNLRALVASNRASDSSLYQSLLDKYGKTYDQLVKAGETPTQTAPSAIPTIAAPPGATGATGATGSTGAAGVSVVSSACTGSGLEMFYSDGSSSNAGQCIGPAGKTGATGATGAAGADGVSIVGPAGPAGPTGATGATGASGQDGTNGTNGADGVGVKSITCITTSTGTTAFEFTLTDGTTRDVAGTCTPPISTPTPTN